MKFLVFRYISKIPCNFKEEGLNIKGASDIPFDFLEQKARDTWVHKSLGDVFRFRLRLHAPAYKDRIFKSILLRDDRFIECWLNMPIRCIGTRQFFGAANCFGRNIWHTLDQLTWCIVNRVAEVPFRFVSLGKRKRYRFQGSGNGNGTN
jgi:hypothetical protein